MSFWSGWLAAAAIFAALLVPIVQRLRVGKRADIASRSVGVHVYFGFACAFFSFLHPLTALFNLGSPEAVGGGSLGLTAGGLALVVLLAHTGIGLKLRQPKLKKRASSRRAHTVTAITIVTLVLLHAGLCWFGARS